MRLARVFPRRTKLSPDDELAFYGPPPRLFPPEVDEVHVSVTFTYDLPAAELLAKAWAPIAPTKIGGPALGEPSGEFEPGKYLRRGCVITSRGCPNRCWYCSVWKREPRLLELPIRDGYLVQDDNLLACSEAHVRAVFAMLRRQKEAARFQGGFEAKLLRPWHIDELLSLKPKPRPIFFAYDTPDDLEPLREASKLMRAAGFTSRTVLCYCLVGYPGDSFEKAAVRLDEIAALDMLPFSMLYRDRKGSTSPEWRRFQRENARPALVSKRLSLRPSSIPYQ